MKFFRELVSDESARCLGDVGLMASFAMPVSSLAITVEVCNFAMRQLMQKVIRVASSDAVSIMGEAREIEPLRPLRYRKVFSLVDRRHHEDRLKRALSQADVAGLRAVRPAGFITEKSPKPGAPHCSTELVALAWRVETAERRVAMPVTIAPVAGQNFRELLPAVAPNAAQPQSSLAEWTRWSPATRLSQGDALKPAVDLLPQRAHSTETTKVKDIRSQS
jgi:hypothetical protein